MIILPHRFHIDEKPRFDALANTYFGWEVLENPNAFPLSEIEIMVANGGEWVDEKYFEILPNLKVIFVSAVGHDALNKEICAQKNIKIANAPNINTDDVADLAMGLLICGERNIMEADRLIRAGDWARAEKMVPSFRLRGRVLGIYGMGAIGMEIAKRAVPFGMKVIWHSRNPKPEIEFEYIPSLLELARQSDILMVSCALNDETRGSINATIIEALGKDGVIINIARGAIIDEAALIAALREGRILGAGLDVFDPEPTDGNKWRDLENTVLTPHFSGKTRAAREQAMTITIANIERFLKGEEIHNRVL